jgi:hypothetical protein
MIQRRPRASLPRSNSIVSTAIGCKPIGRTFCRRLGGNISRSLVRKRTSPRRWTKRASGLTGTIRTIKVRSCNTFIPPRARGSTDDHSGRMVRVAGRRDSPCGGGCRPSSRQRLAERTLSYRHGGRSPGVQRRAPSAVRIAVAPKRLDPGARTPERDTARIRGRRYFFPTQCSFFMPTMNSRPPAAAAEAWLASFRSLTASTLNASPASIT